MFGMFKKKVRKAAVEVKKMENRDAVEATVWGAYAIAYADGSCDAKEISVLEKTISALPSFSPPAGRSCRYNRCGRRFMPVPGYR